MTLRSEVSGTTTATYAQAWTIDNRLAVVTNTLTGEVTRFSYDADGNRVLKSDDGGTTYYATGSAFELSVPNTLPPLVYTITVDGPTITVPVSLRRETLVRFVGTQSQSLSLGIDATGADNRDIVTRRTNGSVLNLTTAIGNRVSDFDLPDLPANDTYEFKLARGNAGVYTFTLSSPVAVSANIDGPSVPAAITRPGQSAVVVFNGTAGQYVNIAAATAPEVTALGKTALPRRTCSDDGGGFV